MSEETNPFYKTVKENFERKEKEIPSKESRSEESYNESMDRWKGKTNEELKDRNSPYQVYNSFWHNFFIVLCILLILSAIGIFLYFINEDKFKSIINQDVVVNPLFNYTSYTNNTYKNDFVNNVENRYNNTVQIINNIFCPGNNS